MYIYIYVYICIYIYIYMLLKHNSLRLRHFLAWMDSAAHREIVDTSLAAGQDPCETHKQTT